MTDRPGEPTREQIDAVPPADRWCVRCGHWFGVHGDRCSYGLEPCDCSGFVSRSGAIAAWDQRVELAAILADPDTVTEACIAFVGEPWRAWSNEQKASCRLRMTYALAAIIPKEQP